MKGSASVSLQGYLRAGRNPILCVGLHKDACGVSLMLKRGT